jgi:hypothetical protein
VFARVVACLQHGQDEQAGCLHQLLYRARLLLESVQELVQDLERERFRYDTALSRAPEKASLSKGLLQTSWSSSKVGRAAMMEP